MCLWAGVVLARFCRRFCFLSSYLPFSADCSPPSPCHGPFSRCRCKRHQSKHVTLVNNIDWQMVNDQCCVSHCVKRLGRKDARQKGTGMKEPLTRPASQVFPRCGPGGCLRAPCAAGCPSLGLRCGQRSQQDWAPRCCWGRRRERWDWQETCRRPASSDSDRATHWTPDWTRRV